MNELLSYLLKSTLCLSLLYLAFRMIMHKEAYFALNRMVLLAIAISSILIPLVILPKVFHPEMQQKLMPEFPANEHQMPAFPVVPEPPEIPASVNLSVEKPENPFSVIQAVGYFYLGGMLFSISILLHGLLTLLLLYRKAQIVREQDYRIFIVEKDIPAFSFCKMIFISKTDYKEHGVTILTHEMQHIRLGHFYDLLLMEMAKLIHWFNPITYWLIQDLKAIHEFQADRHTLSKGIDATNYQLLIIEKGVGSQRFALANSFNHCQIKKRITMMNQSKNGKAWRWKVATFLPLLALLLMAFGRTGENVQKDSPSQKEMLNQEKAIVKESAMQSKDSIYSLAEVMPEFPGGQKAQNKWLRENIKYPEAAKGKIQGKVFVAFIIDSQGKIINPKIVRSVDPTLDAEALRVVSIMPKWIPAKNKGKNVSMSYTLPINFVLSPDPSKKTEKQVGPPPPPPNNDTHVIRLNNDGSLNYNLDDSNVSFDVLENKVRTALQKNPKLQYYIYIEQGKTDERLPKVKNILQANGSPKIQYFSFQVEKGTDSKESMWSRIIKKPMDIK